MQGVFIGSGRSRVRDKDKREKDLKEGAHPRGARLVEKNRSTGLGPERGKGIRKGVYWEKLERRAGGITYVFSTRGEPTPEKLTV